MADRLAISAGDLFLGVSCPGSCLQAFIWLTCFFEPTLTRGRPGAGGRLAADPGRAPRGGGRHSAALGLIFAVLGSIFFGIATPTEAAGVGAAGALLLAAAYGRLNVPVLKDVLWETSRTTAFIFAIFLGATAYSLVLRGLGGDALIDRTLLGLPFGPDGIILTILLATFILGFFLDWIEITLIVLPLVAPVVQTLGFDLVWFTVLFAVCLQTSFLTPPVGFAIFYLRGVAPPEVTVGTIYRGVVPFVLGAWWASPSSTAGPPWPPGSRATPIAARHR